MQRRLFVSHTLGVAAAPLLLSCRVFPNDRMADSTEEQGVQKLVKSEEEWREILPPDAFDVLREEETERPFSSPLDKEKRAGTFVCAGCFFPLFSSADKFDSGTGWPSFTRTIEGQIGTKRDFLLVFPRKEYHCARCGGHQGHVFNDGPAPRGERWCNNGVALRFVPTGEAQPALRI
jgi:peptide-methionine (R)-S-oxide reductase